MIQWPKNNDVLATVNRGNPAESGLCTLCRADCTGKCETWLSCLKGRELMYPRDFGTITSGSANVTSLGLGYHALRIQGYNYGAEGAPAEAAGKGDVLFTDVSLETAFGRGDQGTKCRLPFMTGALGSTFIAAKYWESFAAGCAICGIPIVVGENVVGIDKEAVIKNGRISKAPELERRINTYYKYYDGMGGIIVQLNVEDSRNGVAEYVMEKFGDKVIIELKWGQGAKDIGGEIQVTDINYAKFLKERGYLLDPDPTLPEVEAGYKSGSVHAFARHSRLGYTNLRSADQVMEEFMNSVGYLRKIGFKRISLKTGSYGMEALAMALRLASEARLALLTIDGSGGGTGMSPWDMMEQWGVPSLLLHAKTYEYARILADKGIDVVDLALAGGFARSSAIFKGLALSAPFVKLICMGRAMMIPGFLGANIEGVLKPANKAKVNGNWDSLPKSVSEFGSTAEEIFAGYRSVEKIVGKQAMAELPFGAIAMWTCLDKLGAGLQQFMAGARRFGINEIRRSDIASANREMERETGIPFLTEAQDEAAKAILNKAR